MYCTSLTLTAQEELDFWSANHPTSHFWSFEASLYPVQSYVQTSGQILITLSNCKTAASIPSVKLYLSLTIKNVGWENRVFLMYLSLSRQIPFLNQYSHVYSHRVSHSYSHSLWRNAANLSSHELSPVLSKWAWLHIKHTMTHRQSNTKTALVEAYLAPPKCLERTSRTLSMVQEPESVTKKINTNAAEQNATSSWVWKANRSAATAGPAWSSPSPSPVN